MPSLTKALSFVSLKYSSPQVRRQQLALVVSVIGAAIMAIAIKADWIGGTRGFALDVTNVMLVCGGFALLVSGLMLVSPAGMRPAGESILAATAGLAVVIASDLADKLNNGAAGMKLVLIAFIAIALNLGNSFTGLDVEKREIMLRQKLADLGKFLSLAAQLGLLVLLIRRLELVSRVFCHQIIFLTFYGFLLHYFLPLRYRLPFFLFLSLSGIVFIFGFVQAGWLIGVGLVLIGICHIPVRFPIRVVLLLLAAGALVECRIGWIQPPWSSAIWPILGSMFMFRLIAYMYSLKHGKAPAGVWRSLSYFFLLPNVVFPLFPVVDYTTFCRTYYDTERHQIYQTGVKWILRGIIHLLLYRYVYYYVTISPEEVDSVTNLVRYMVSSFMVILKLSGQFHLIVGLLHLFGFNLPETMNRYFLASSFTDFWRRANIYWKDFMQRVVFYPVYFRLRNLATTVGLAFATLVVFVVTWSLHSYQWFWLRGSFSFSAPDVLFWTLFGLLVLINTLYEARYGRKREMIKRAQTWGEIVSVSLRIVGTFCVICVLWSLWVSTSVSEWLSLWSVPRITWKDITTLGPAFIGAMAVIVWMVATSQTENERDAVAVGAGSAQPSFFPSAALSGSLTLLLLLVAQPIVYNRLGAKLRETIHDLSTDRLNEQDNTLLQRGYYENLTRVNRFNSQLWELYSKQSNNEVRSDGAQAQAEKTMFVESPENGPVLEETNVNRLTGDFLDHELRPSVATLFHGEPFHTNRWGMRDKDYEMNPPPGTYRIALLGASPEIGWGLGDGKQWETLLENRLNRDTDRKGISQYEILNFSCGGYTPLQRLAVLEEKALSFAPDMVFFVAYRPDKVDVVRYLVQVFRRRIEIPYDYLRQLLREVGVEGETNDTAAIRKLRPFSKDILSWTDRRVVELCRQRNIVPIYLCLPRPTDRGVKDIPDLVRLAKEAGFVVVDLSGLFQSEDKATLGISETNRHPNAIAQSLIANAVYNELKNNPTLLQKLK